MNTNGLAAIVAGGPSTHSLEYSVKGWSAVSQQERGRAPAPASNRYAAYRLMDSGKRASKPLRANVFVQGARAHRDRPLKGPRGRAPRPGDPRPPTAPVLRRHRAALESGSASRRAK